MANAAEQGSTAAGARHEIGYRVALEGAPGAGFAVREIQGEEGLSRPFRFEARVVVEGALGLDPEALVGGGATIHIERDGSVVRAIAGVLSEVALSATRRGQPELRVVVEPSFALLRHRSDARVFVDRSVPEIVSEVLGDAGVSFALRLAASYPKRACGVQYGETDLVLITRLLEDEGIFYWFDGDGTMILADDAAACEPGAVLPFRPAAGFERQPQAIHEIGRHGVLAAGAVSLRDFNPDKPELDMDVAAGSGPVANYDYPGKYALPAEGQRRAALAAEALSVAAGGVSGQTDAVSLAPAMAFSLLDGPPDVPDGAYAITAISHDWRKGREVSLSFEALDAATTYRPARVTAAPEMTLLTGFVTGPEGADVHTDEMGRVKVRFPWDRRSAADDSASHWIPVLQDNTGHSLGIPRTGWEVAVGFLDGDPERPVVLGRVYNGSDPFPEPLPAHRTVSALRSVTSPGRGGANLIRLEDAAGREQIQVQAQRDQNIVVVNDKDEKVLSHESNHVGGAESITIGANRQVKVGQSQQLAVDGDERITVAGDRSRDVAGVEKVSIAGDKSLTVGGSHQRKVDATDSVTAAKLKETIGVVDIEASLKANKTTVERAMILMVGGAMAEATLRAKNEKTVGLRKEIVGGLLFTKAVGALTLKGTLSRSTTVGGLLNVNGKTITLEGKAKLALKAAAAHFKGKTRVTLVAGKSTVTLSDGEIVIDTPGSIEIKGMDRSDLTGQKLKFTPP